MSGTLFTLLAALGFAAVSTLTSIAIKQGTSLPNVLTWRYVLSSIVLVLFVGIKGYKRVPSREIANCAIAVPCGVANGISKFQRGIEVSMRLPPASTRSGSEATCNSVWRASAASVSSSR